MKSPFKRGFTPLEHPKTVWGQVIRQVLFAPNREPEVWGYESPSPLGKGIQGMGPPLPDRVGEIKEFR